MRSASSSSPATADQSYCSTTSERAADSRFPRRPGSRSNVSTASANDRGSSARSACAPGTTGRPSAPTVVETTALPIAIASKIFSRVPPPMRSGTMYTAASLMYGRTSSTVPVTLIPSAASARTAGVGARPTIDSDTRGSCSRISGRISAQKYFIASSFGSQSMEPVNTRRGSALASRGSEAGTKYSVSTPVRTTHIGLIDVEG